MGLEVKSNLDLMGMDCGVRLLLSVVRSGDGAGRSAVVNKGDDISGKLYGVVNREVARRIRYRLLDLGGSGSWQLVPHEVWSVMVQLPGTIG